MRDKQYLLIKLDELVKSPFSLDLGIQGLRNCELFKVVTIMPLLKNGQIATFYETVKTDNRFKSDQLKSQISSTK
tara:strand:- start:1491 stop:1715 length:225 start_codon:yes stop_codon:yes gene_type:complete